MLKVKVCGVDAAPFLGMASGRTKRPGARAGTADRSTPGRVSERIISEPTCAAHDH